MSTTYPDWLSRLMDEEAELTVRINKLRHFLKNEPGPSNERINDEEYRDLRAQLSVMVAYQEILLRRIRRHVKD